MESNTHPVFQEVGKQVDQRLKDVLIHVFSCLFYNLTNYINNTLVNEFIGALQLRLNEIERLSSLRIVNPDEYKKQLKGFLEQLNLEHDIMDRVKMELTNNNTKQSRNIQKKLRRLIREAPSKENLERLIEKIEHYVKKFNDHLSMIEEFVKEDKNEWERYNGIALNEKKLCTHCLGNLESFINRSIVHQRAYSAIGTVEGILREAGEKSGKGLRERWRDWRDRITRGKSGKGPRVQ